MTLVPLMICCYSSTILLVYSPDYLLPRNILSRLYPNASGASDIGGLGAATRKTMSTTPFRSLEKILVGKMLTASVNGPTNEYDMI